MNISRPIKLSVHAGGVHHCLSMSSGTSVRDALDSTDLRVRAACGGTGSCGACVVRLIAGEANPHTTAEYQKLTAEERNLGLRLACQLRPRSDVHVELDDPAPPSRWKSIPADDLELVPGRLDDLEQHVYGVAVDLGTTHIRVSLWDRKHGKRIATRRGLNPQGVFGADVLNRLDAALGDPARAREIAQMASTAVVSAVRDILARDLGEVSPMLAEIGRVVVVGNTAMLALLTEHGGEALLSPDNWGIPVDCRPVDANAWQAGWSMPHAQIILPEPVAGFIGPDALATLLATRLVEDVSGTISLDVGTNTEIALWDGQRLHLTSVPGGPAFEGMGIRHGMCAEAGAISGVTRRDGEFCSEVVGGGAARGFCGSGLNDAIAMLLEAGILKPSGRFAEHPGPEGYELIPGNPRSAITGADVDAFQRAKAATAAAMETLLERAGMKWRDIRRMCVCGAFGRHLHVGNAQAVGLLPPLDEACIELHADAALAGCERALLCADGEWLFAELTKVVAPINLSYIETYEDRYIDHLRLKPISLTR